MRIGKFVSMILAIIVIVYLTFIAGDMLNQLDTVTSTQKAVKAFIFFSVINTCGRIIPCVFEKVFFLMNSVFVKMLKKQSNTKPYN